jgi:uncharacterized membrane protein YfcA
MLEIIILILAGCGSGMINAVAGGGNMLVLPVYLALGLSPFQASITGSIPVVPASYAATYGYRKDLRKLPRRYFLLLIPCLFGAAAGIYLLHRTPVDVFEKALPWLVLFAVGLFIFQPQLHRFLRKPAHLRLGRPIYLVAAGLFLSCIYGGYYGAGVGFLILVLLGFTRIKSIYQMTGMKSLVTGTTALLTVIVFSMTGQLAWKYGLITAAGSIFGGYLGARLAHRISPRLVLVVVVIIGIAVVIATFAQAYL